MSFLSFDNYISKARESQTGTIRIAKGDPNETQLVNKGTFGNGLATIFDSIGKAIVSLFGGAPDQTKAQRNEKALTGFKEALIEQFGESVALKAWSDKGLDDVGKLKGQQIIDVSDHARSLMLENRQHNNEMLKDCLPIDYRDRDYMGGKFFAEVCRDLGYDLDVAKTLTPERYGAYYDRLITAFNEATNFDSKALTPDESKAIARGVLKEVVRLDLGGRLDEAQKARQEVMDSGVKLFSDIAQGRSPRRVLESLLTLQQGFDKLAKIEGKEGGEGFGILKSELLREVMVELNTRDPKVLGQGRDKIFGDGSSVRALVEALRQDDPDVEGLTHYGEMVGTSLVRLLNDVVVTLAKSIGSHTESTYKDSVKLDGEEHVRGRSVDRAMEVVQSHLETLTHENVLQGPTAMLDDLKLNHVGKFGEDNLPTWHSTEVLKRQEDEVSRYARLLDIPLGEAVNAFRVALQNDPDLPDNLKAKLLRGLDAIESGPSLYDKLDNTEEFRGFEGRDIERFFKSGGSKWDLEHYNQGSLSGLHKSFEYMLDTRQQPLTGEYVEELQKRGTENSFTPGLQDTFKRGVFEEAIEMLTELSRTPSGFRVGTTDLTLDKTQVTEGGQQALRDNQERLGYRLTETETSIKLDFHDITREGCKARTDAILQTYAGELEGAQDEDEKLNAIGKAIQDLYRSHVFKDGNTRTAIILMNRMLLDNGLSPCILTNPKALTNCSLEEFVGHIKDGQETFRELKR